MCCVLPDLISDVVLGIDWLYAINYLTDTYLLSLVCGGATVCIMGTKYSCSCAFVDVCALKLVLKTMHVVKVSAWFSVIHL